jgi:hypothetical protein
MRQPLPRGTALDNPRFDQWLADFGGYVSPVTRRKIELWLEQFALGDRDLAARLLDAVLFLGHEHIRVTYRTLLDTLPGWNEDAAARTGRWVFVPFSGSVGESGDSMMHIFRMATGMTKRNFKYLFAHRSELVSLRLTPVDTVVLVDDFSGTGSQAKEAWKESFAELFAEEPRVFLVLVAATQEALTSIQDETEMEAVCGSVFQDGYNFFDEACTFFTAAEKAAIEQYCRRADRRNPRGRGNTGLLVVFAHRCPNNCLPILHARHRGWSGLFPRDLR